MVFNSYIFLFLFLPITLIFYYLLGRLRDQRYSKIWLIGMSLWFYGYFNPYYLWIIVGSIIVNYIGYRYLIHPQYNHKRKLVLTAGIICNVAALFYFKYFDFFIANCNRIFQTDFTLLHIVLPLGISFFTFQQISFLVDVYREEVADYTFLDYTLFVTFFPQLVAGPIVTHKEMLPQFKIPVKQRVQIEQFSRGILLITIGLGKKVLLADNLGEAVNWGYTNLSRMDATNAILVMLMYMLRMKRVWNKSHKLCL